LVRRALTWEEYLELTIGPNGENYSEFGSEAERKGAWFANRDELMASVNPTTRPWAFWEYEIGKQVKNCDELDYLQRKNLLTESEKRLLLKWGRAGKIDRF